MACCTQIKEVKLNLEWKEYTDAFVSGHISTLMSYAGKAITRKCPLTVYVQGELGDVCPLGGMKHELVFLTVHDVGTNPQGSFIKFVNSPAAAALKRKSVFIHVCIPGQESGAKDIIDNYPTVNQMAEMLPQIMEHFGLVRCVAMGEGAGADVVCRFAFNFPELVNGLVLIHCTSTTHGIVEHLKETFANLRIDDGKMTDAAWDYLLAHKYGEIQNEETRKHIIDKIRADGLNENNLSRYLYNFSNREDFTHVLAEKSEKVDTVLVTGGKSPHNKNIFHMFEHMDKTKTGLVVVENVVDVLSEAPEALVQNLISFCQRHVYADAAFPPPEIEPEMDTASEKQSKTDSAARQPTPPTPLGQPAPHPDKPTILTTSNAIPHPEPVQMETVEAINQAMDAADAMKAAAPVDAHAPHLFAHHEPPPNPTIMTTSNTLPSHEVADGIPPVAIKVPPEKPTDILSAPAGLQKQDFLTVCPSMCRHGSAQSDLSNVECPHCAFDS